MSAATPSKRLFDSAFKSSAPGTLVDARNGFDAPPQAPASPLSPSALPIPGRWPKEELADRYDTQGEHNVKPATLYTLGRWCYRATLANILSLPERLFRRFVRPQRVLVQSIIREDGVCKKRIIDAGPADEPITPTRASKARAQLLRRRGRDRGRANVAPPSPPTKSPSVSPEQTQSPVGLERHINTLTKAPVAGLASPAFWTAAHTPAQPGAQQIAHLAFPNSSTTLPSTSTPTKAEPSSFNCTTPPWLASIIKTTAASTKPVPPSEPAQDVSRDVDEDVDMDVDTDADMDDTMDYAMHVDMDTNMDADEDSDESSVWSVQEFWESPIPAGQPADYKRPLIPAPIIYLGAESPAAGSPRSSELDQAPIIHLGYESPAVGSPLSSRSDQAPSEPSPVATPTPAQTVFIFSPTSHRRFIEISPNTHFKIISNASVTPMRKQVIAAQVKAQGAFNVNIPPSSDHTVPSPSQQVPEHTDLQQKAFEAANLKNQAAEVASRAHEASEQYRAAAEARQNYQPEIPAAQQEYHHPFAVAQQEYHHPFAIPQQEYHHPFAVPQQEYHHPFAVAQQEYHHPFAVPQQEYHHPFAVPQQEYHHTLAVAQQAHHHPELSAAQQEYRRPGVSAAEQAYYNYRETVDQDLSFLPDAPDEEEELPIIQEPHPSPSRNRSVHWSSHATTKLFHYDERVVDMMDCTLESIHTSPHRSPGVDYYSENDPSKDDAAGASPVAKSSNATGASPAVKSSDTAGASPVAKSSNATGASPAVKSSDTAGASPVAESNDAAGASPAVKSSDTAGASPVAKSSSNDGKSAQPETTPNESSGFTGVPASTWEDSDASLDHSQLSIEILEALQQEWDEKLALAATPTPAPVKDLVEPLSDEELDKIDAAATLTDNGKLVSKWIIYQKLNAHDFSTLLPEQFNGDPRAWLNDNIVNEYLDILITYMKKKAGFVSKRGGPAPAVHAFSSFWYPTLKNSPNGVARWAGRFHLAGKQYLDADLLLYPICDVGHWRLLAVKPKERTIEYLDSLGWDGSDYLDAMRDYLAQELGKLWKEDEWTIFEEQRSVQQINSSDCGVFAILNALALLRGEEYTRVLPSKGMSDARERIAVTLLTGAPTTEFD